MTFVSKGNVNSLIATKFFLFVGVKDEASTHTGKGGHDRRTVHLECVVFTNIKSFGRNDGRSKSSDARQLVARARVEAQINRITYGATVPVDVLVKKICDFKQSFTQYGGSRPFGTALLIGGVDDNGIHLYETDPSGAYQSYHAGAIGSGRNTVIEFFEDNWKENMTLNAAMKLGLEALRSANDAELNREAVEVTVVDSNGYRVLDRGEVNKQIDRLKPLDD